MTDWTAIEHFEPYEFDYPDKMSPRLIHMLDIAREMAEVPFVILGDWRPKDDSIGVDDGDHETGEGVEIEARNSFIKYTILKALLSVGFRRIGIYDQHIHAGIREDLPQNVVWIGLSQ